MTIIDSPQRSRIFATRGRSFSGELATLMAPAVENGVASTRLEEMAMATISPYPVNDPVASSGSRPYLEQYQTL